MVNRVRFNVRVLQATFKRLPNRLFTLDETNGGPEIALPLSAPV